MDIFKEDFPNNVINDLYKLCFQNYRAPLIYSLSSYKKKQFKLHRSLLGVRGGGGGVGNQPSEVEQPSLQHLAVMVKINIFRPNFS